MNKKIKLSLLLIISISNLNAGSTFVNPLGNKYKSTDNGGILPAIDAYKDGIGVIVLDNLGQNIQVDNSAMNTLVYKYGDAAKASGSTIVEEVMYGSGSTNIKDKSLVGKLTVDGQTCNDNNAATTGETWLNGNCQGGINTNGTSCNDSNVMTINDIYTNGVCTGTLTVNGQACNDGNAQTNNDIYTNGICSGDTLLTNITNLTAIDSSKKSLFTAVNSSNWNGTNDTGLFDNNTNQNHVNGAFYWTHESHFIKITVNNNFRLWSYGAPTYENYDSMLQFTNDNTNIKYNTLYNGVYNNYTNGNKNLLTSRERSSGWHLDSNIIPAGTYTIKVIDSGTPANTTGWYVTNGAGSATPIRMDSEWFLEKVN